MSGFETKKPATRAAVILPWEKSGPQEEIRAADARLEEAVGLTASIGLVVVRQAAILLRARRPATRLGSGQVEQLAEAVKLDDVDVVVIDARLSPGQQRNLEKALACQVVDRPRLVLDPTSVV